MFTLSEISSGYIVIEVRDQDVAFETLVHDYGDHLQSFADFTASLIAGDYPASYVSDQKIVCGHMMKMII
ncbi:hypothetical protein [Pseudochrobactrum saccharolyticum]|uniref:hypothetical protein n=1 Tax=Pseudochrobactrum saccharolyticum TaxID=354352 RepID=UPI00276B2B3C|nr:hypothetical protein [Pseudochrobactrum saccharolyticum]MDP8252605.1 hypothetical protein [Pseudochrobactrum saccharolyticum]